MIWRCEVKGCVKNENLQYLCGFDKTQSAELRTKDTENCIRSKTTRYLRLVIKLNVLCSPLFETTFVLYRINQWFTVVKFLWLIKFVTLTSFFLIRSVLNAFNCLLITFKWLHDKPINLIRKLIIEYYFQKVYSRQATLLNHIILH